MPNNTAGYWEHFDHDADLGIRGVAPTLAESFAQAGLALSAAMTDLAAIDLKVPTAIGCSSQDPELLFLDWINELVYRISVNHCLYGGFEVRIEGGKLSATAIGEPLDRKKHQPAVEVKGATFTELRVYRNENGMWVSQCVIDV